MSDRTPPNAITAEQELLGECMRSTDALLDAMALLHAEDFYDPLHGRIWAWLAEHSIEMPTPISVAIAFKNDPALEKVGGEDYLFELAEAPPSLIDVKGWCTAIADTAQRRRLLDVADDLKARIISTYGTAENARPALEIAVEAEEDLRAIIAGVPTKDDPAPLYTAVARVIDRLGLPVEERKPKVPFGVAGLDAEYGGMWDGDLIILAGRPGMGKTAVAICMADAAVRAGKAVAFCSLEMKQDQLAERWLSMRAYRDHACKIPYNLIRMDKVNPDGQDILSRIAAANANLPLIIDERRGQTVSEIAARTRREQMKLRREGKELGLVLIDHLHRIRLDGFFRNMAAEVTQVARALKDLAGALGVPIVALSQLSRAVEGRDDKQPQLSDLRESGAIEEEADYVFLLYRPEYYANKTKSASESAAQTEKQKREEVEREARMQAQKDVVFAEAAKVRHGRDGRFEAKCRIAYNWIDEFGARL